MSALLVAGTTSRVRRRPELARSSDAVAVKVRSSVAIPLRGGACPSFVTFDGLAARAEHFALRFGAPELQAAPLVGMHSECITGDVFGSLRCDCGAQLDEAIDRLHAEGGVLLYLRQEGRGIGLTAKLDAYKLQDGGLDTYEANAAMSLPADGRDYGCGADMLRALGLDRIRLMTNNPDKVAQLERYGLEIVERVVTGTFLTDQNRGYLLAKAERTRHSLTL